MLGGVQIVCSFPFHLSQVRNLVCDLLYEIGYCSKELFLILYVAEVQKNPGIGLLIQLITTATTTANVIHTQLVIVGRLNAAYVH